MQWNLVLNPFGPDFDFYPVGTGISGSPATVGYLLLENGDRILSEDGADLFIIE